MYMFNSRRGPPLLDRLSANALSRCRIHSTHLAIQRHMVSAMRRLGTRRCDSLDEYVTRAPTRSASLSYLARHFPDSV